MMAMARKLMDSVTGSIRQPLSLVVCRRSLSSVWLRAVALRTAIVALALLSGHAAVAQAPFDPSLVETVETVRIAASGQRFVPRQSLAPGGSPRHTANYDVTVTWNPGGWQAREEWQLETVYPLLSSFAYTMTYGTGSHSRPTARSGPWSSIPPRACLRPSPSWNRTP